MQRLHFIHFVFLISILLPITAHAQHSDVLVTSVNGQVAIGAAEDINGPDEEFNLDTNTFESILVPGFSPVTPADYESEEPGFFALNSVGDAAELAGLGATALPGDTSLSVSLSNFTVDGDTSTLFYWDGTGSVDFAPAPAGTSFAFDPAVDFATTNANGGLDDHPIYELDVATGVPADGVYLISPVIDVAGLTTSDNFYIVLLADALITGEDDAELVEEALEDLEEGLALDAVVDFGGGVMKDFAFYEEAVEFVEETVAIPEPTSLLLGLSSLGLIMVAGSRKR